MSKWILVTALLVAMAVSPSLFSHAGTAGEGLVGNVPSAAGVIGSGTTAPRSPRYVSVHLKQSIDHAQAWVDDFVLWYNTVHLHSAICFITPDDRHYGRQERILSNRHQVYENARRQHPSRWSSQTRDWNPVRLVWLNPEKKDDANPTHLVKKAA